jgi:hypothetical protein
VTASSSWNYRILFDGTDYWVGEVYYEGENPIGYTGASKSTLCWDDLSELRGAIDLIAKDSASPVLRVDPESEAILGEMP